MVKGDYEDGEVLHDNRLFFFVQQLLMLILLLLHFYYSLHLLSLSM